MALEYIKTFDEEAVAEKFDTSPRVVARILSKPEIQSYLAKRLVPLENIAELGAQRLLEEALKTALDPEAEWKERTENRKLLARSLLPELKKIQVEHNHYIKAPAKSKSIEEWKDEHSPEVQDADFEIVDE